MPSTAWVDTPRALHHRGRTGQSAALLCLIATVLTLCAVPARANGILLLQISGYMRMTEAERAASKTQLSPEAAMSWCNDRGGALVADSRDDITSRLKTMCSNDGTDLCSTILDGSAKPRRTDLPSGMNCVEDDPTMRAYSPSSMWCTYRWRAGFYDIYAEVNDGNNTNYMIRDVGEYNPGLCYFRCMYYNEQWTGIDVLNHFCNGFVQERIWNSSKNIDRLGYPHGKFQIIAGMKEVTFARMDTPVPLVNNAPNPFTSFRTFCYLQDYPLPALWTTRMEQPEVVKGYKVPTWPQEHWWVIFLIVAVILLSILIFIIIYCTVTSAKPKEEPMVATMVQRERDGHLYGELDDDYKSSSRNIDGPDDVSGRPRSAPMGMPPYQQPMMLVDPEDLMQGLPRVFSQDDTMLTTDGDSFANDSDSSSER